VAPLLLLGSEYRHIETFMRLCALGEGLKVRILEAWGGCSHKKLVAASAITAFWNLTPIKTRALLLYGLNSSKRAPDALHP
ncbi:hypothetical protein Tco_0407766, partial [Tanacetum coccineum]